MIVLMLDRVKPGLRGELTRWLIEPRTGVFVGNVSALVRDKLWDVVCERVDEGAAILIQTSRSEQGFSIRSVGEHNRRPVDWEGLTLIAVATERKKGRRGGGSLPTESEEPFDPESAED